jgi:hypothetical protein
MYNALICCLSELDSIDQSFDFNSLLPYFTHAGDHPEDVKARLKYWAQAVACTVRLCS